MIPTFNRAADVGRALRSITNQTYEDWEAIVVDNHSSDDTLGVIGAFGDPRIRVTQVNNGGVIAISRNAGIVEARGEYVAFLDSDDWWKPRKLELSIRELDRGSDVVYHDLHLAGSARFRLLRRRARTRQLRSPVFADLLLNGNAIVQSSVVMRRQLLTAIGGIAEDPRLVAIEDYDTWLRVARVTEKFRRLRPTLGYYWTGGGNTSNPARTISTVEALEARNGSAFDAAGGASQVAWINYAKGRSYLQLGRRGEARDHLRRIPWRASPELVLRSRFLLAALKVRA